MTWKDRYEELHKKNQRLEIEFELFRSLVENSLDLIYRTDIGGVITYISPSVFRMSGYTVEEAIGMNMAQEVYRFPEEREKFLEQLREEGHVEDFEAQLKRKDGSSWWASTNARFYKDADGNILGVEGITRDISSLKETNQALHESETLFRLAFHISPDSVNLNRISDGMYIKINQGFTEMTGYTPEDIRDKTSIEIKIWDDIRDRERLIKGLKKTGYVKNLEARFIKKNGETLVGLMSARRLSLHGEDVLLSITRDISDLKQAQEIMIQSEKMLSVGGLSAGMAHEINNPLAGMVQNSEMILRRLTDTKLPSNKKTAEELGLNMDAIKTYMEKRDILKMAHSVKQSGGRIANIVENMLSFARSEDNRESSYSIPEILDRTIELAKTDFDLKKQYDFRKINIIRTYEKGLPLISCEPNKLQQVFLNILNNGAYAMQQADTENPTFILKISFDTESQKLCIEMEDNGPGMDGGVEKRIFEPFFTTKPVGVGTGLGLSVSYFIITENHRGEIKVDSEKGKGCKFIIHLPRLKTPPQ